jgi:hypothetical protein
VDLLHKALEVGARTMINMHGPNTCGALALALDEEGERRTMLAKGESLIAGGCVGHNQLRFYPDAIEVALDLADYDGAERYAALLEDYTRSEPLPWSDFFIARGRALATLGRGTRGPDLTENLRRLREQGDRFGYRVALPALETVLARTAAS